jgi:23S rRNA pseudouridine1911/1915/1917 synthase
MQEKFTYTATDSDIGKRIDLLIKSFLPDLSRVFIQDKIKSGLVFVNGEKIKNSYKVEANDIVEFSSDSFVSEKQDFSSIEPMEMDVDVVFEDEHLIVVNKPTGISSHASQHEPNGTLVNALIFKYGRDNLSSCSGFDRLGIVHRLDKETSGLMVVAKNDISHAKLSAIIADKIEFKRKYLAICYGVPVPASGIIERFMKKGNFSDQRMMICDEDDSGARFSSTSYKVLKTFFNGAASMIEFELSTGRTHQIRLHAASIGHHVLGDGLYRPRTIPRFKIEKLDNFIANLSGQALQSYNLEFQHPMTGEILSFSLDYSERIRGLVDCFES